MTAKILESFGAKFAEQWVATLLTPAFVFWLGGFAAIIQRWGWQFLVAEFTRHPEPLQIALLVGCLCIVVASAFIVQRFDLATLRFLEGYWHQWLQPLRQYRIRYYRHRKAQITQQGQKLRAIEDQQKVKFQKLRTTIETQGTAALAPEQRDEYQYLQLNQQFLTPIEQETLIRIGQELRAMPITDANIMPTQLGNLLRAVESKPLDKYGLDAIVCWPRLWMLLPDAVKKDLQEARTDLNIAARIWLWSILFCGWTLIGIKSNFWAIWPLLTGLFSACFAYGWAIEAASTYGELIESAFDLHRHLLYQALRWYLPPDPVEEQRVGKELTQYLRRRS